MAARGRHAEDDDDDEWDEGYSAADSESPPESESVRCPLPP